MKFSSVVAVFVLPALLISNVSAQPRAGTQLDDIAALAAYSPGSPTSSTSVEVLGYKIANDGGGGLFVYSPTGADNGCTVFPAKAGGHWKRVLTDGSIYLEYCGADRTGVVNSSSAIQTAFLTAGANSTVKCTAGASYKVVTGVTISQARVHFVSDGKYNCVLNFAPTASGTLLTLSAGASVLFQGSVTGITFCSSDTTYVKKAIVASDISLYELSHIVIGCGKTTWHDSTGASVGLQTNGRENSVFDDIYSAADIPIAISKNPNAMPDELEDADHFHFSNLYLTPKATGASVVVDTGVYFSQTVFDGYQAWVSGAYGMYWNDTIGVSQSQVLNIENVRAERITGTAFYLHSHGSLLNAWFKNIYTDAPVGFDFAKIYHATVASSEYANERGVGIQSAATAGVENITLINDFWQTGTTFNLSGYAQNWATGITPSVSPLPSNAVYLANDGNLSMAVYNNGVGHQSLSFTLADGASLALPAHDNGITSVRYDVAGVGATKTIGGVAIFNTRAVSIIKTAGTADFSGEPCGAGNLCIGLQSATVARVRNRSGETLTGTVDMTFSH